MTWKSLGLNRHKTDSRQLVYVTFDSAAITMQAPSDDITHYTPVIASVQCMGDVRKLVTSHLSLRISPDFTSKLAIPTHLRDVVRIIDNFSISHDEYCHG